MYKCKFDWKMAKMANFQALPTFPLFPKLHDYTNRYTVIIALQKKVIFVGPKKLEISVQRLKIQSRSRIFSPAFQNSVQQSRFFGNFSPAAKKEKNPVQQNEIFEKSI